MCTTCKSLIRNSLTQECLTFNDDKSDFFCILTAAITAVAMTRAAAPSHPVQKPTASQVKHRPQVPEPCRRLPVLPCKQEVQKPREVQPAYLWRSNPAHNASNVCKLDSTVDILFSYSSVIMIMNNITNTSKKANVCMLFTVFYFASEKGICISSWYRTCRQRGKAPK